MSSDPATGRPAPPPVPTGPAAAPSEPNGDPHRPPRWWGAVVGVLAAGAGLATGEFVAGFSSALESPVVKVADRVIDWVPKWMKDFAIDNFGTDDKKVLLITILTVITASAVAVGIATVRRAAWIGVTAAAVFGAAGAWAGGWGRNTTSAGVLPALAAAAVACVVLLLGRRMAHPRAHGVAVAQNTSIAYTAPLDRRGFLVGSGIVAVAAIGVAGFGRQLQARFNSALERAGVRLPTPADPLPPLPADPATDIDKAGLTPLIVPIRNFYRIDTAISFPDISLADWRLRITGLVGKELSFSYDELLARDLIERDITLSCVSNEVGGNLVGNARWVGCRLDDLLDSAGIDKRANQIMGVSTDGFTAGFPVDTLDGRDAMVVFGMNNEVLPVKNGFPARIVVPGLYGYVSAVKWLREIRLTTFEDEKGYWIPRGWAALGPVKTQSRIDRPRGRTAAGHTVIGGVAWAPGRGIDKVEVQIDDGDWALATLGPVLSEDTWVQWWLPWEATQGDHVLRVRATDGRGETQTEERARVDPDGATGWHTVRVNIS